MIARVVVALLVATICNAAPTVEERMLGIVSADVGPGLVVFPSIDCSGPFMKVPFSSTENSCGDGCFDMCQAETANAIFSDGSRLWDDAAATERIRSFLVPDIAGEPNSDGKVQKATFFVDCSGQWKHGEALAPGCYSFAFRSVKFEMVPVPSTVDITPAPLV